MKCYYYTLLISLFSPVFLSGQKLFFHSKPVDTIQIKSHRNVEKSGGIIIGKADWLVVAYDQEIKDYRIRIYFRDDYKTIINLSSMEDSVEIKTKVFRSLTDRQISRKKLRKILSAFSSTYTPQENVLALESANYKKLVSRKQIRKVIRRKDAEHYFDLKHTTTEKNEEFFKSCQSPDTLQVYFESRFDTSILEIERGYLESVEVKIVTGEGWYSFFGRNPYPTMQPWFSYTENSEHPISRVLNLDINRFLPRILPENFLLKDRISLQEFMNDYISWYIERRFYKED